MFELHITNIGITNAKCKLMRSRIGIKVKTAPYLLLSGVASEMISMPILLNRSCLRVILRIKRTVKYIGAC